MLWLFPNYGFFFQYGINNSYCAHNSDPKYRLLDNIFICIFLFVHFALYSGAVRLLSILRSLTNMKRELEVEKNSTNNGDEEYEVKRLLAKSYGLKSGKVFYLVEWEG